SLLMSYEDWPKEPIIEQKSNEKLLVIRGKDTGRPTWHYIFVPHHNLANLKAQPKGSIMDVTKFGRISEYRNNRGEVKATSGWGTNPPRILKNWLEEYNSSPAVDENISLTYINDDIRLCTMQRAIPEQLLGYFHRYFAPQRFHYIELIEDLPSSLARRAGLKSYDRIIFLNGVNVENDSRTQFGHRFDIDRHLPVEMLVCSPATYEHYKANQKIFHFDLSTIQRLKPVYATSSNK
ncbi:unnamed protein product, partial [Rotaria sordida]